MTQEKNSCTATSKKKKLLQGYFIGALKNSSKTATIQWLIFFFIFYFFIEIHTLLTMLTNITDNTNINLVANSTTCNIHAVICTTYNTQKIYVDRVQVTPANDCKAAVILAQLQLDIFEIRAIQIWRHRDHETFI